MKLQEASRKVLFAASFLFLAQMVRLAARTSSWPFFCNPDGAWSVPLPLPLAFLIGIPLVLLLALLSFSAQNRIEAAGWLLLFSGGLSNLFERYFFGCIGDYIRIFSFPVFNVADAAMTCGILLVASALLVQKRPVGNT